MPVRSLLALLPGLALAAAAPVLPPWLGDDAVVQRDRPIRLCGTAAPGARVAVRLGGAAATATAGADGAWSAVLPAMPAGGPYDLAAEADGASVTAQRVMLGDIWLCAGQSNMAFALGGADGAKRRAQELDGAPIRLLGVRYRVADAPQAACAPDQGGWTPCTAAVAERFSAVALAFARRVQADEAVTIGLVLAAKPGSFIEGWIPGAGMAADPVFAPILARWRWLDAQRDALQTAWTAEHAAWQREHGARFDMWKRQPLGLPFRPHEPSAPPPADSALRPAGLWNGMLAPLTGMALRGVVWYQGESNSDRAFQYRDLLPRLIAAWRGAWADPALPVVVAQLPEYATANCPYDWQDQGAWEVMRESQALAGAIPGVAVVTTLGLGDPRDIHPRAKWPVGERLGAAALAIAYHRAVPWSGPRLAGTAREDGRIVLRFAAIGGGLLTPDGGAPVGFAVAGADRVFVPATAAIIAPDAVALSAPSVAEPLAARYAWADAPICDLYGGDGLPAAPCRSDDWPLPTQGDATPFGRRWPPP